MRWGMWVGKKKGRMVAEVPRTQRCSYFQGLEERTLGATIYSSKRGVMPVGMTYPLIPAKLWAVSFPSLPGNLLLKT